MDEISIGTIVSYIAGAAFFIFAVCTFFSGFFTIKTMRAGIVERFGKFNRIAEPGVNFKIPWIESVVYEEDLSMQLMDVNVESKTKDDATVTIPVRIQYYVLKDKVEDAYYKLDDPDKQIHAHVENVILSYIPTINLDDAYLQEDQIAKRVKETLISVMAKFGYAIENALVTRVIPAQEIVEAMNNINAARRKKVAAEANAAANQITVEKAAEADANAKEWEGKGIAMQRKAILEGLQTAIKDFEDNVKGVDAQEVMRLVVLTNYMDMMKEIGQHSNTILLPSGPSGANDLMEQIRTALISSNLATENAASAAAAGTARSK